MEATILELSLASGLVAIAAVCFWILSTRGSNAPIAMFALLLMCVYFGFGPFISAYYGGLPLPSETEKVILDTYLSVALFAGALTAGLAFKFRRGTPAPSVISTRDAVSAPVSEIAILLTTATVLGLRVTLAVQYNLHASGSEGSYNQLPYALGIATQVVNTIWLGVTLYLAVRAWLPIGNRERVIAISILILELIWMWTQGRRWVLQFGVFLLVGYLAVVRKRKFWHWATWGLGAALVWFVAFPYFLAFRGTVKWNVSSSEVFEQIDRQTLREASTIRETVATRNLVERPLVNRFLCRIVEFQQGGATTLGGAVLKAGLRTSIPAALVGSKSDLLPSEQTIQAQYGMRLSDTSSTWVSAARADFGLLGCLLYGFLVAFMLRAMLGLATLFDLNTGLFRWCTLAVVLSVLVFVEEDIASLFVHARNLAIAATFFLSAAYVRRLLGSRASSFGKFHPVQAAPLHRLTQPRPTVPFGRRRTRS